MLQTYAATILQIHSLTSICGLHKHVIICVMCCSNVNSSIDAHSSKSPKSEIQLLTETGASSHLGNISQELYLSNIKILNQKSKCENACFLKHWFCICTIE